MPKSRFQTRLMCENEEAVVTPLPGNAYIQKLIDVVGQAQHTVDIMMFQWCWYKGRNHLHIQKFNQGVIGLLKRGVKFRVIMDKQTHGQSVTKQNLHTAEFLRENGARVKFGPQFPCMHSKIFIIDDNIVVLGSHNLSDRGTSMNEETSVLIYSRKVAMEYKRYYESVWNRF